MERAERLVAERVSGVPNLTYDLVALLHAKLEAISVYEIYMRDAREVGHGEAAALFAECQAEDRAVARRLQEMLAAALRAGSSSIAIADDADIASIVASDSWSPDDFSIVDESSMQSFPASDSPAFTGSAIG